MAEAAQAERTKAPAPSQAHEPAPGPVCVGGARPLIRCCAACGSSSGSDGKLCPSCAARATSFALQTPTSGRPLPPTLRHDFEARFGEPLGNVRLHTETAAEEAAAGLNARAFAFGSHIAFARGQFDPSSAGGRRLLAHELAHTLQPPAPPGAPATIGRRGDAVERDAATRADRALRRGGPPRETRPPRRATIQRYSFGEFLDDAGGAASTVYDTARSAVHDVAERGEHAIATVAEEGEHIGREIVGTASGAVSSVVSAEEDVIDTVESAIDRARNVVEEAWRTATGLARDAWDAIKSVGSWIYAKGAAFAGWLAGKLTSVAAWLGSLLGVTIRPVGTGVEIDFPDYELFPREDHIPLPIQLDEIDKTFPIAAVEVPIGPVIVGAELDAKVSLAATSAANVGPVMLRHVTVLLDPLATHYRGTGEIDAPAEAALEVVGTGTLLGQLDLGAIVYGVPIVIPTIGVEGGIRLTGIGTIGGDARNVVTLDYAAGRFTFADTASLAAGILLQGDADAILGITFAEKDVCSWAWHLGDLEWGRAFRGSLDVELAAGGPAGRTRTITGRLAPIPVSDVISGVFSLHPIPNCPGLGAILSALGVPLGASPTSSGGPGTGGPVGPPVGPLGAGGGGGGGGGTPPTFPSGLRARDKLDHIPLVWFKPLGLYPDPIRMTDSTGGTHDYEMDKPGQFVEPGHDVGVAPKFMPRIGKSVQLMHVIEEIDRGPGVERFRSLVTRHGFDMTGLDVDHVQDVGWDGPDEPENLWPMPAGPNRSAGSKFQQFRITYSNTPGGGPATPSTTGVRIVDALAAPAPDNIAGRWFVIRAIRT